MEGGQANVGTEAAKTGVDAALSRSSTAGARGVVNNARGVFNANHFFFSNLLCSVGVEEVARTVRGELGAEICELFREFDQEAIAAASLAQVCTNFTCRQLLPSGAIKLLSPLISPLGLSSALESVERYAPLIVILVVVAVVAVLEA